MDDDQLKRFLDQQWHDSYSGLLSALGMNPKAIEEPSDCRTFEFGDTAKAKAACAALNALTGVKATQKDKRVSTVQPESLTDQVVKVAEQMGGKMKGFQLSWG